MLFPEIDFQYNMMRATQLRVYRRGRLCTRHSDTEKRPICHLRHHALGLVLAIELDRSEWITVQTPI